MSAPAMTFIHRPVAGLGFMYQRTISDPDGQPFFMDMVQAPQA